MEKKIITCSHCQTEIDTAWAKRNCSNCFSCSGCERYICPQCDQEVVIKEVKKASWH